MNRNKIRFGDFEANLSSEELRKGGIRIAIEHKPFAVLKLLLLHHGQLVTRQQLFGQLWPDSFVNFERGLNSAVNSLRNALGDSSKDGRFIETRAGIGYRFIAPVQDVISDQDAYQDCLKGQYLLDRMTEEEMHKALGYFSSAASDKGCSAVAYAGIADAYCHLALIGSVCASRLAAKARTAAEAALASNPASANAHIAAGRVKLVFDWDWEGARTAANCALKLDAASLAAHILYAALHSTLGDHQTALEMCRHAVRLNPLSFPANLQLAASLYAAHDFEASIHQCWKILSLEPSFAPAQMHLALGYQQMGMYEEAIIEFENARRSSACRIAATIGLNAVLETAKLQHRSAEVNMDGISTYWRAILCSARRENDQAIQHLETCLQIHDPALLGLKSEARLANLWQLPRYQALLHRMGI